MSVQVQFPDAEQTSFYFSQIKQILKKFRHLCVLRVRQVQYAAEILTLIYTVVNLCQVLFWKNQNRLKMLTKV